MKGRLNTPTYFAASLFRKLIDLFQRIHSKNTVVENFPFKVESNKNKSRILSDGGKPEYWREYKTGIIGYHNDHDDNHNWSGSLYGMVETRAFDKEVMNHLDDHHAIYKDGSIGGFGSVFTANTLNPYERTHDGEESGKIDAASIIASLKRDKGGNIIE